MNMKRQKVPTLQELHKADPEAAQGQDELHMLLSQPPAPKWVKKHPIIKVKIDGRFQHLEYIPEHICRFLLRKIFGFFKEHILREGIMFNSVYVVVRVEYLNPITGEWEFVDGIGAVGAQTDQGEAAGDLSKIKQDAIMKGAPAAAAYAFKNACKKLGKLFGGDLNKTAVEEYTPTFPGMPPTYPTAPPPAVQTPPAQQQALPAEAPAFDVPDFSSFSAPGTPPPVNHNIQF